MRRTVLILPMVSAALIALAPAPARVQSRPGPVAAAVASPLRTPANVARDRYRHPAETLAFFGVRPTDTVVEIWPSGGWYAEILAPLLRDRGAYYAATPLPDGAKGIAALQARDATAFGKIRTAAFPVQPGQMGVPDGVADKVLTFRNVHNWRFGGADRAQAAFDAMFHMLKPGGTLGVVEHRLPETRDATAEEKSGYMKESSVIAFATKAGFRLAGRSAVNANPKDTADWPAGVWTLPPSYRLKDVDRAKYAAIGESDRMTLRFVKPK
ncbi:class I SAM-dependent methyltransferase [Sphingomonas sp. CFBP 13720]|uniref:class I SAM-dependent methyltransferase n=1 Tax=Sphingomonas sp. CFBP 13720 TaxID=2775302 RepID=UPI001784A90F|nr:class I SAM-dependent methyltransferase [Sphingomonas sp. CFBP 13720]MBD8678633.1 class I SAM-dependent methyltransferase [Sphingomonas sp. CFBP 13720]